MSRPLSTHATKEVNLRDGTDPLIVLLRITHAVHGTLYYCSDDVEFTNAEATWAPSTISFAVPSDDEEASDSFRIVVSDLKDQAITTMMRNIESQSQGRATVMISLVLESEPDTPLFLTMEMEVISSAPVDNYDVSLQIQTNRMAAERYPGHTFVPSKYPGLF